MSSVVSAPSVTNPNAKQSSPSKMDAKSKAANPKRVPEAKSAGTAARQLQKSPIAYMLKKTQVKGNEVNRLLVTINVLGSAGPLRFLASCDDPVQKLIETALKSYAREGRLPVFGHNVKQFELHCANSDYGQALEPYQMIGALGTRNFLLCKKNESKTQQEEEKVTSRSHHRHHQRTNLWKNLLSTVSLGFGISSH